MVPKVLTTDKLVGPNIVLPETRRLLPESVVWLYAKNRVAEAEQIIRNAAKLNNITMPDKILVQPDTTVTVNSKMDGEKSDDDDRTNSGKFVNNLHDQRNFRRSDNSKDQSARYTVLDIFRNRHLTVHMFCISFMWSVFSMTVKSLNYTALHIYLHIIIIAFVKQDRELRIEQA